MNNPQGTTADSETFRFTERLADGQLLLLPWVREFVESVVDDEVLDDEITAIRPDVACRDIVCVAKRRGGDPQSRVAAFSPGPWPSWSWRASRPRMSPSGTRSLDDIRFVSTKTPVASDSGWPSCARTRHALGAPPVEEMLPLWILDPDWIPVVAEHRWSSSPRTRTSEPSPKRALAIGCGLRVACLVEPRQHADRWDFSGMVFRHWSAIAELSEQPGPAWLAIHSDRAMAREFQPGAAQRVQGGRL